MENITKGTITPVHRPPVACFRIDKSSAFETLHPIGPDSEIRSQPGPGGHRGGICCCVRLWPFHALLLLPLLPLRSPCLAPNNPRFLLFSPSLASLSFSPPQPVARRRRPCLIPFLPRLEYSVHRWMRSLSQIASFDRDFRRALERCQRWNKRVSNPQGILEPRDSVSRRRPLCLRCSLQRRFIGMLSFPGLVRLVSSHSYLIFFFFPALPSYSTSPFPPSVKAHLQVDGPLFSKRLMELMNPQNTRALCGSCISPSRTCVGSSRFL